MKQKYKYMADMGSIKIMTTGCSIFFGNDFGDGVFEVIVCDAKELPKDTTFKGHFTIFKQAWLMHSDCMNEGKMHTFSIGRYFVDLDKDGTTFYIYKVDNDIHA
jgi:hypothetical protein